MRAKIAGEMPTIFLTRCIVFSLNEGDDTIALLDEF